jgi:ribonuclease III
MIKNKTMEQFIEFEEKIDISFENKALLKQAFLHRSYLNENRNLKLEHNERLEFLGDAVLELAVTDYLYKKFTNKPEGELTAYRSSLVNSITLAKVATDLEVNKYLLLSRGEAKDTGRARQYILANTLEAIIGAIYLDRGYEEARYFIDRFILHLTDSILKDGSWIDAKSRFQEKAQEKLSITPSYKTTKETGPDHDKYFTVGVYLQDELIEEGLGKSKQDAEQEAAKKALIKKGW